MNFYIYNLKLSADLPLHKFGLKTASSKNADIKVKIVATLDVIPKKIYSLDHDHSSVYIKNVAQFKVSKGREISIFPHENVNPEDISAALLNFPLATCMSQKGFIVIHASSITKNNVTIMFCGQSHAGKSTLAYAFKKKGWEILSEDICVIEPEGINILNSQPSIKLSSEAIDFFGKKNFEIKKTLNCERKTSIHSETKNLRKKPNICFFLSWQEKATIKKIHYSKVLSHLLKYSFITSEEKFSKQILELFKEINFYDLNLKKKLNDLDKSIELITKFIEK